MLTQLTSLRYVAALAVLLSHMVFLASDREPAVRLIYARVLSQGGCGVAFFFVLSGFVIAHAYRDALLAGRLSPATYLLRRAARIFPLHWLVTLAVLAWAVVAERRAVDPATALLNLSLLHGWAVAGPVHFSFNGPSWSLSAELFFYAVFPALILIPARGLAVTVLVAVGGVAALASLAPPIYSNDVEWLFYVNPLVRLIEFAAGMLVHHAFRTGVLPRAGGTAIEMLLLVLVPATMIALDRFAVALPFRYQLAWLPLMAALVFVFAQGRGRVTRALRHPLPVLLGEASFALYLTHRPIITLAHRLAERAGIDSGVTLALVLVAGCTLVAVFVHLIFDRPLQQAIRRWSPPTRPVTAASRGR